jgi:glycosyltransferase involved in cell wall biosynthesis
MNKNLEYSILMSVYYKEKADWLKESINSMLNQSVKPAEFVIIKDGKLTDELDDVISQFHDNNQELFSIYELSENVGLGRALAYGVNKCKHNLIVRMDSDDISDYRRCEKLINKYCENTSLDIIGSWENEFEESINNSCAIHKVPEKREEIYEFMKRRCGVLHPTVMYKKQSVLAAGNYQDVRLYEDYDLFLRMVIEHKMKAYNIQEPLYHIRINDDFYKRRGGLAYMNTVLKFKWQQYKKGYFSLSNFSVSAGGQAVVCLLPNSMRKKFYMKFLRR